MFHYFGWIFVAQILWVPKINLGNLGENLRNLVLVRQSEAETWLIFLNCCPCVIYYWKVCAGERQTRCKVSIYRICVIYFDHFWLNICLHFSKTVNIVNICIYCCKTFIFKQCLIYMRLRFKKDAFNSKFYFLIQKIEISLMNFV